MKYKILLLITLFVMITISCKKEKEKEDNPIIEPAGYIEFDGQKMNIDTCFDIYYSGIGGNYYHYYILVNKNVYFDNFLGDLIGTGNGFTMQFQTNNNNLISAGNYALDSTNTTPGPGKIIRSTVCINYNFFMSEGEKIVLKSGNIELKEAGLPGKFEINGTFIDKDNKECKVYFKGMVVKSYSDYFSI